MAHKKHEEMLGAVNKSDDFHKKFVEVVVKLRDARAKRVGFQRELDKHKSALEHWKSVVEKEARSRKKKNQAKGSDKESLKNKASEKSKEHSTKQPKKDMQKQSRENSNEQLKKDLNQHSEEGNVEQKNKNSGTVNNKGETDLDTKGGDAIDQ